MPNSANCPSCGAEIEATARFCPSCGQRLDLPVSKEEERKLVTVLFADLAGSTALGEQLDPDRLRALLTAYFSAMSEVIESWEGTVEKFAGDAVMAVFGIPASHEDDAERALHAALEMQARLRQMNPELARRHGVHLTLRVGVNTGEVIAGTSRDQFMVTGDAVNVAARLQQDAGPGEVAAGERTYLSTRGAFIFKQLGEKRLKGKSISIGAWRVVEPIGFGRPRGLLGVSTRLIGRERELVMLDTLYRRTLNDAHPALGLILGEGGIGKSRLTEEFVARIREAELPPAVYWGRCLPYGEGITYWALREILGEAADIHLDDSSAAASFKLEGLVHELLEDSGIDASNVDRVLFALAKTAGISLPRNPLDQMSPESIGEELGLAWPLFMSSLARKRPILIVVEDLHRAEPPLLDMIERLVSRCTGCVLLVATARPEFEEFRPAWESRLGMSRINLEPLNDESSRQLLEDLLPQAGPPLRNRILTVAEGNPLFAEEIVAHLTDEGVLQHSTDGIVEVDHDMPLTLPDTVRALLAARVDALLAEEKRTLQDAAVIGRNFWATTLESMRPNAGVLEILEALEEKALVVAMPVSSLPGQKEFSFRHGLTREVAYQSIPRSRRAAAHAGVGRWIEQIVGDRREEYVDLIAHHFESAAQPDDAELAWPTDAPLREKIRSEAISALLDAGRAAMARFAIDAAIGFGSRALELAIDEADRLASLELKAQAARAAVRPDEAWPYYMEALEIAERTGDAAAVARLRANATLLWARYAGAFTGEDWRPQAVELVRRGLEEAGEDATFEVGALLTGRAQFIYWELAPLEMEQARRDAERAVEIAQAIESPVLLSYALDALCSIVEKGGFCNSADLAQRVLRVARRIEDRVEGHEMLVTSAIAFSQAGRFDDASAVADEAVALAADLGSHRRLHAAAAQTSSLLPVGRIEELRQATAMVPKLIADEEMHTCSYGLMALSGQALTAFELNDEGDHTLALELFDSLGFSLPDYAHGYQFWILDVLRPLHGAGAVRARLSQLERPKSSIAWVYMLRAELQVRALTGEWDEFASLAAKARDLAPEACAPYLSWIADWGDSVRVAASGRSVEALAKARVALASLESFGDLHTTARLLADLVGFLEGKARTDAADEAARRLEAMGARASAAMARAERRGSPS
jgi:class 3 adenylate cyclase/tetratricopeptide (TPR) repeat protein